MVKHGGIRESPPFFLEKSMNTWIKTNEEKLQSLIADEAKQANMLISMQQTIKQMQAKSAFRLALLNQLLEDYYDKYSGN